MSALTFQDLSTELTQAIESQLDTPSGTKARCTLGREKVMVLVEYPLEGNQAEPPADSTLDWLERSLRTQFDTVGLPEEAADLTETGEAVSVQLFLKHLSEPKPFTARSFVWKVADGFSDLFGEADAIDTADEVVEADISSPTPIFQDETGSLSTPESEGDSETPIEAEIHTETGVGQNDLAAQDLSSDPVDSMLTEPPSDEALEADAATEEEITPPEIESAPDPEAAIESDLDDALADNFLPLSAIDNLDSEIFSLPGEEPAPYLESSELDLPTVDMPVTRPENSGPSDEGFFDIEADSISKPTTASDSELAADFENALDRSTANLTDYETNSDIALSDDVFDELLATAEIAPEEESTAQLLETEAWEVLSSEASTAQAAAIQTGSESEISSAHHQLTGSAPKSAVILGESFENRQPESGGDIPSDRPEDSEDWGLDPDSLFEDEAEPGEEIFDESEDLDEDWQSTAELESIDSSTETLEGAAVETENLATTEVGFDAYGSNEYDSNEYGAENYSSDDYSSDDYALDEPELEGDDTDENDEASHDEIYELTQISEEDAAYEEVALIDEREVQRQREQWQQQTKGNPWFFAGAIGFFVVGLLGFVLTRPCTIGACPRINTAKAEGERALSDLTLGADLKAVTAAKQQLNRSVRSLQPIPIWSRHHAEANAVLPKFESQLTALDRVSAAQSQAYEAAVASQNPPHSSAKWEAIAQQWRDAIATLEAVPTDNQVRRLANRKLTEYRANLSTIKVRIDAESKAEASLIEAQQAATLATATAKQANSLEAWESALFSWELAVDQIDLIPKGTLAYNEAQALQIDYRKQMELVRDRTLQERNASRNLSKAEQLASDAQRVESEDQWTVAVQTWTAAVKQIQDIGPGTAAHTKAQPMVGLYQQSLAKAESNRQVSQRFQPVEPSFYAACGATATQKCTYSVSAGNVRLNLVSDYDRAINQSITPPDQRNEINIDSGVVTQSNQLLKEITLLSTQAQVPIELYDAKGEFLARYRPDLNGFVKDREET